MKIPNRISLLFGALLSSITVAFAFNLNQYHGSSAAMTLVGWNGVVRQWTTNSSTRLWSSTLGKGPSGGSGTGSGGGGGGNANFLGMEEDDDEDDDFDDDEDDDFDDDDMPPLASRFAAARSPFTGLKLDPYDPNPMIKPRPSSYFSIEDNDSKKTVPDDQLEQKMTMDERMENLKAIRQIYKKDLDDLRLRRDYAGLAEANNEMKRRLAKDPWFDVNDRLRDAILLGEPDKVVQSLRDLAARLGGPPSDVAVGRRGYALNADIYDMEVTQSQILAAMEKEMLAQRMATHRAMVAERKRNQLKEKRKYEDEMRNPGERREREARERHERTMRYLRAEIEEDNKKKMEKAKEMLGKVPDPPERRGKAIDKALEEVQDEFRKLKRKEITREKRLTAGGVIPPPGGDMPEEDMEPMDEIGEELEDDEDDETAGGAAARRRKKNSSADKARSAAAAEASGGRPRLAGDPDVTRGEVTEVPIESSSSTTTGPLTVEVKSSYNKEQSDPPMRKHCFQYTIRITNNSPTETIQLLGRRFEIQTVCSSKKDIVQGEGVTGRTPILKPGEVFEYTSTAPLSVRPVGTTIIAARMKGEYRYVALQPGQEAATDEQIKSGGEAKAELGMFHFVFPDEQRVKPFRSTTQTDEEEEEDDDDDDKAPSRGEATAKASTPSATSSAAASTTSGATTPTSTLPGDTDMRTGSITVSMNDSSEALTESVRVQVSSTYRPESSDNLANRHCFAYNIRITNESNKSIQLVSRRFEIQTIGSATKDVVQGPGVTGRQPVLKPGESFEYTSTAPLSVKPMSRTPIVARMQGEYSFVVLGSDGTTPISSTPQKAKLGMFHFILPQMA